MVSRFLIMDMLLVSAIFILNFGDVISKTWIYQKITLRDINVATSPSITIFREENCPTATSCVSACKKAELCFSFVHDELNESCTLYKESVPSPTESIYRDRCPESLGYTYDDSLHLCYWFSTTEQTWNTANDTCYEKGGRLIKTDTEELRNFYKDASGTSTALLWVGATDLDVDGTFVWSDGDAVDDSFWGAGQPNNIGSDDCGVVIISAATFELHDAFCTYEFKFACQFQS